MSTETIRVNGLVDAQFRDAWLYRVGIANGRFDAASAQYKARFDASESIFTQRALAYLESKVFPTLIPPIKAREFVPTQVKANQGAEFYVWQKLTRTGIARLFAPGAALDLPVAGFMVEQVPQRFYPVGVKLMYNYFELLAVGMALENGQPVDLVGEKMKAALEAVEKKLDLIAAFGTATPPASYGVEVDADPGLLGILNQTLASTYTTPTGASGSKTWAGKTGDEVLADLFGIRAAQRSTTFEVHDGDTLLMPILQYDDIASRRLSDISQETILSFFIRTQKEIGRPIEVHPWQYNAGAGSSSSDRMVLFKRDPAMLQHVLAMDATPLEASKNGLVTEQPVVAKTAGLVLHYPLSVTYGDFIG